jgi:hypothetical protein
MITSSKYPGMFSTTHNPGLAFANEPTLRGVLVVSLGYRTHPRIKAGYF